MEEQLELQVFLALVQRHVTAGGAINDQAVDTMAAQAKAIARRWLVYQDASARTERARERGEWKDHPGNPENFPPPPDDKKKK